tara:strand:+ start:193 stop:1104 length:912 start_codon:yes stop_codon:yes gene_type:complete
VNNINIVILGSNGQLAKSFFDLIDKNKKKKFNFIFLNKQEVDITKKNLAKKIILSYNPKFIINFAAYTNVDRAEIYRKKANNVNNIALNNLAKISKLNRIILIHISTDYVFDGRKNKKYSEVDKPKPKSFYGMSKLLGEQSIINNMEEYIILRTSWIYSKYKNNFIKYIIDQLINGNKEINVVKNQYGSPYWTNDISNIILKIINKVVFYKNENNFGIFHLGYKSKKISRVDVANEVIKILKKNNIINKKIKINQKDKKSFKNFKIRPDNSSLSFSKLQKIYKIKDISWKKSLENMIIKYINQ